MAMLNNQRVIILENSPPVGWRQPQNSILAEWHRRSEAERVRYLCALEPQNNGRIINHQISSNRICAPKTGNQSLFTKQQQQLPISRFSKYTYMNIQYIYCILSSDIYILLIYVYRWLFGDLLRNHIQKSPNISTDFSLPGRRVPSLWPVFGRASSLLIHGHHHREAAGGCGKRRWLVSVIWWKPIEPS